MEKTKVQADNNYIGTGLESLAEFLNFEFDPVDVDEHERLKHKYDPLGIASRLWQWEYGTKTAKKAEKAQKQILCLLLPIVSPWKPDSRHGAREQIENLLGKINKFEFRTGWTCRPIDDTYRLENPNLVVSPRRQLTILGYRWAIHRYFEPSVVWGFSMENLYLVIHLAIESEQFPKLKICQKCQRFFVAEPLGMKACNKECARAIDRKEAARRVTDGRREKRDEKQRRSWPAKERRGVLALLEYFKQTRKGIFVPRNSSLGECLSAPGYHDALVNSCTRWARGDSLNDIWGKLPDGLKEGFLELRGKLSNGLKEGFLELKYHDQLEHLK